VNLVWFRNDLRLQDNPALHAAADRGPVLACYLLTPGQWRRHRMAGARVDFILRSLRYLSEDLARLNIPLVIEQANFFDDVAPVILSLAKRFKVSAAFWNEEYPLDEQRRDEAVADLLLASGVVVNRFHDRVIAPPGTVLKSDGRPYRVFTPFKRTWLQLADAGVPDILPVPAAQAAVPIPSSAIPETPAGFSTGVDPGLWPAGEREAMKRLRLFGRLKLKSYPEQRDIPAVAGTSILSPYLAVGAVSPQQCLRLALQHRQEAGEGAACWINELAWRDFYQHLVVAFPQICKGRPFKTETARIAWRDAPHDFERWCQGNTGVPIVDAGMRQLLATGWMHNRVRMITAMFLSKNLLIDWRRGEAYFMEHLIDGDFAANNGGWQWSASTGTDAVPYFRVFNPFSQAARFDPEGIYIRRFVPALKTVDTADLHDPLRLEKVRPSGYPEVIVDLKKSRLAAIAAFKSVG